MALTSTKALYTDVDPNGPVAGRILPETDPDARFTLCGVGGAIPDDVAAKYKLADHPAVSPTNEAKAQAELVGANRQTYTDNALAFGGGAYKGLPGAEVNLAGVAPDQISKVQEGFAGPLFQGIDSRAAKSLQEAGLDTPDKINATSDEELSKLAYVTDKIIPVLRERTRPAAPNS